jgi:nucleoside-diphosphate-sugar epimerase
VTGDARGPFNLAAGPVMDGPALAAMLGARTVRLAPALARAAIAAGWYSGLVPASPYLFDLALRLPVMDTTRAREQLGWSPRRTATETIEEFLAGLRANQGLDTPPLSPETSGPLRLGELGTGLSAQP